MTRKHFNAIAEAFSKTKPENQETCEYKQWEKDVHVIADSVSQFNHSFDFFKFIQACGIDKQ